MGLRYSCAKVLPSRDDNCDPLFAEGFTVDLDSFGQREHCFDPVHISHRCGSFKSDVKYSMVVTGDMGQCRGSQKG